MAKIGEDVSERLDVIPAQLRVLVTRRPKYACRRCSGAVAQAHAPEHVVPGGLPTEALIAEVIVAKFGEIIPAPLHWALSRTVPEGRLTSRFARFSKASGDLSARKASTSAGVGGSPVRA